MQLELDWLKDKFAQANKYWANLFESKQGRDTNVGSHGHECDEHQLTAQGNDASIIYT